MAELARGSVTDRPWGLTFGALGVRGLTGELAVDSDGKPYRVSFYQGAIIGAYSPLVADAAVRVALTGTLIPATQVADIRRRVGSAPDRDEIELLAELARLTPEQTMRLRRRLLAQRAARAASVERGTFVVDDQITLPYVEGTELDIRAVCYVATKTNFTEDRMADELERLGGWFKLKEAAVEDLPQFGFHDTERPILQMLVAGADLAAVEEANPNLGARTARAVTYALLSCGALEIRPSSRRLVRTSQHPVVPARTATPTGVPPMRSSSPTSGPVTRPSSPTSGPVTRPSSPTSGPAMRAAIPGQRSPSGSVPVTSGQRSPTGSVPVTSGQRSPTGGVPVTSRTSTGSVPVMSRTATGSLSGHTRPQAGTMPPGQRSPTGSVPGHPDQGSPTGSRPVPARTPRGNTKATATARTSTGNTQAPVTPRTSTGNTQAPVTSRTSTGDGVPRGIGSSASGGVAMKSPSAGISVNRTPSAGTAVPENKSGRAAVPRRAKRDTAATREIEQLLASKIPLLDGGGDHFQLLGLSQSASVEEIRQTYFLIARKLHPDRLASIGLVDEARNAQRLMAAVNAAFAVLNDNLKRAEYIAVLGRGGEAEVRRQDAAADELAMRVLRAEEVFRQGEMALRRDQLAQAVAAFQSAVELAPGESEYQALLAWAMFAAAPDKSAVAAATRGGLPKAAEASTKSPTAKFYLGRVERMLGKEKEALALFQEVLRIKPSHADAASEARVLEQRLKGKR